MGSFAFVSFEFGIVTDRQHSFPAVGILINGAAAVTDGRIVMEFGIVADGAGCALIVISAPCMAEVLPIKDTLSPITAAPDASTVETAPPTEPALPLKTTPSATVSFPN